MTQENAGLYRNAETGGAAGNASTSFEHRSPPSRRAFIKGVIASGAAASAAGYLFRGARRACRLTRRLRALWSGW